MQPDNKHFIRCLESLKMSLIFGSLNTVILSSILSAMSREKWRSGIVKNSIDAPTTFHFIISGRLKVYQINPKTGREHTTFLLTKGDVFDIFNLLDSETHHIYWETIDDLELLTCSNKIIQTHIVNNPSLNNSVFRYLGKRMRALEDMAVDASIHNTLTRLSNLLLKNINGQSQKLELINNLANDEIASLIGTTRAVVNRHIQELKKAGAISVKRKQIDIENLKLLIAIAEEKYSL